MTLGDYYENEINKYQAEVQKAHEDNVIDQIEALKHFGVNSEQIVKYLQDKYGLTSEEIKDALTKFEKSEN